HGSGVTRDSRAIAFSDANTGTIVGYGFRGSSTAILRTTDGGATWVNQSDGTQYQLNAVSFTDTNHGTAVGSGAGILHTTDGGATWELQSNGVFFGLWGVSFTDT